MMHCELESNSTVWVQYTNMTYQARKSETLEQLMHHWPTIAVFDHGLRLLGFSKSVIYWGVKLFMVLYVKMASLCFNRFTIGSILNSLNISADGVLKSACILTSTKSASLIITDFLAMIYKNEQPRNASLCRGWAMLDNDFNLICR